MNPNVNELWFANWDSVHIRQYVRCVPVYSEVSTIQRIEIVDTVPFGRLLLLDGQIQNSTLYSSYIHESLYHPAFLMHGKPEKILIIGGGDGSGLVEVLKYRTVKHIDLVDIDEAVTIVCKKYLPGIAKAFEDLRIATHYTDGVMFVQKTDEQYDIVILDISDPIGPATGIYTRSFYENIKKVLRPGGFVATHCESPESVGDLYYIILATLRSVFRSVIPYRVWIPPYFDMWGRVILTDSPDVKIMNAADIKTILDQNQLQLNWLTPDLFDAMFKYFSADILRKLNQDWPIIEKPEDVLFRRP